MRAKRALFPLLLVAVLLMGCEQQFLQKSNVPNSLAANPVMVVAHRACWQTAPENSIAAIETCIRLGVDIVEIDVRRTRDGVLVVMHDETVDRTTNGRGRVNDLSLAEIRRLRLADGSQVPTLTEVLRVAKDRILVNLDAKEDIREQAFQEAVATATAEQVLLKSRAPASAIKTAGYIGRALYMPVIAESATPLADCVASYAGLSPFAYEVWFQDENYLMQGIPAIASQNARLWVNTLGLDMAGGHDDLPSLQNPDAHWGRLLEMGVDIIQTDYPIELIHYLRDRKLHN